MIIPYRFSVIYILSKSIQSSLNFNFFNLAEVFKYVPGTNLIIITSYMIDKAKFVNNMLIKEPELFTKQNLNKKPLLF